MIIGKSDEEMDAFNDRHLYVETPETRGSLLWYPALEKYVRNQSHFESLVAKKRRKAAEEWSGAGVKK